VTTATKPKAPVGRPKSPQDVADRTELVRIATLAAGMLTSLRQPGRGVYDSERVLRSWLQDDGVSHSTSDIAHALSLLESTGKIGRSASKPNVARTGWLIVNGNGNLLPQLLT
jgi:hypothetical protein